MVIICVFVIWYTVTYLLYVQTLNGPMLVELVQSYVNALNSGGVPVISTAWERVVASQYEVRVNHS